VDSHLELNQDRPVMIHRAIFGSLERCIAILCEHFGGKWPFWLSPRQIQVIPVAPTYEDYADEVRRVFHDAGFYADVDLSSSTLDKKIRDAQLAQYNMILVVGQEELEQRSANVRTRDNQRHGAKSLDALLTWFKDLSENNSNDF
jgi:threonyl-tRNA synthetase